MRFSADRPPYAKGIWFKGICLSKEPRRYATCLLIDISLEKTDHAPGRQCTADGTPAGSLPGPGKAWIAGLRRAKRLLLRGDNARGPSAPRPPESDHGEVHKLTIMPAFPGGLGASRSLRARGPTRVSHTPPPGDRPRSGAFPWRIGQGRRTVPNFKRFAKLGSRPRLTESSLGSAQMKNIG